MIYELMVKFVLNNGISYCQLYAMVRNHVMSLELGRMICIIAYDWLDDPLFVPRNTINDGDVLTAGLPQGSYTIFETLRIIYRLEAILACERGTL